MRFVGGGLVNLLKIRRIKFVPEIRLLSTSQRYRASSNGHNNKREENKSSSFIGTDGAVKCGLIILSAVGLTGFMVLLKKNLFRKANCDESLKNGKAVENGRNPDNFVTGDICFKEAIKKSKGVLEKIRVTVDCL